MMRQLTIILIASLTIFGCKDNKNSEQYSCTASIEPGIVIEIRDAVTDEPLAANAVAVITSTDYRETLIVSHYEGSDSSSAYAVSGAHERPGIYDIEVSLTGYKSWFRYGVEVTDGICHVGTVRYTARLEEL
jgi:hypothetical protein